MHLAAGASNLSTKAMHMTPTMSRLQQRRRFGVPLGLSNLAVDIVRNDSAQPTLLGSSGSAFENYDLCEVLGQGSAGVVRRARRRTDERVVAMKIVRTADVELLDTARREFELLKSIEHPRIIHACDFFVAGDRPSRFWSISKELSLSPAVRHQPLRRFQEDTARILFRQLMDAVDFLHCRRIIHRDIKASNMLVSENLTELKLLDFNTAHRLAEGGALTMTGTHEYAAPEVLLGSSPSEMSDVWSAGLCLHLMLVGRLPRRCEQYASFADFADAVSSKPVVSDGTCLQEASEECKAVLRRCLEIETSRRPAAMTLLKEEMWLSTNPVVSHRRPTVTTHGSCCRSNSRSSCGSSSRSTSCGSRRDDSPSLGSRVRSSSLPPSPLSLGSQHDLWGNAKIRTLNSRLCLRENELAVGDRLR